MSIQFTVPGKAVPQGGMRAFAKGNRAFVTHKNPEGLADFRSRVAQAAREAGAKLIVGPVHVTAIFYMKRPLSHFGTGKRSTILKETAPLFPINRTGDLDKFCRSLGDALTGECFNDDSQIVTFTLHKRYADYHHTVVSVSEMTPIIANREAAGVTPPEVEGVFG